MCVRSSSAGEEEEEESGREGRKREREGERERIKKKTVCVCSLVFWSFSTDSKVSCCKAFPLVRNAVIHQQLLTRFAAGEGPSRRAGPERSGDFGGRVIGDCLYVIRRLLFRTRDLCVHFTLFFLSACVHRELGEYGEFCWFFVLFFSMPNYGDLFVLVVMVLSVKVWSARGRGCLGFEKHVTGLRFDCLCCANEESLLDLRFFFFFWRFSCSASFRKKERKKH